MIPEIPKLAFTPLPYLSEEDKLKEEVNFILNTPPVIDSEATDLSDKNLSVLKELEKKRQYLLEELNKSLPIIS